LVAALDVVGLAVSLETEFDAPKFDGECPGCELTLADLSGEPDVVCRAVPIQIEAEETRDHGDVLVDEMVKSDGTWIFLMSCVAS
jgi:hypothetical protein